MKRLNIIIGKKQIAIASLTVLLGAAVAVNFIVSSAKKSEITPPTTEVGGTNYGDAAYVSNTAGSDAYFAQARLDKQQSRDEAAEVIAGMYQGGDMTRDELTVVETNAQNLSSIIESENKIETLLKAQGFEDALCYLSGNGANIIVKTDGLDAAGAAKIKSTLLSEVEVAGDNITIVEVK
ncbi:MAG: SpoIIIAH-like family protein [Oscillospiraceae bacterium]|nr:SpoIIIAH-like family protein [Oscillospiraceae bacterium]